MSFPSHPRRVLLSPSDSGLVSRGLNPRSPVRSAVRVALADFTKVLTCDYMAATSAQLVNGISDFILAAVFPLREKNLLALRPGTQELSATTAVAGGQHREMKRTGPSPPGDGPRFLFHHAME